MGQLRPELLTPLTPSILVVSVHVLDHFQYGHDYGYWNRLQTAVLDEPAHLATAMLALLAVMSVTMARTHRAFVVSVCAGSVLIDLDHIPLYEGVPGVNIDGRPFTHSLATVILLSAGGVLLRGLAREVLLGLSLGVLLHLTRDIATGPGVPLWWPTSKHAEAVAYPTYAHCLGVTAVLATLRQVWDVVRARAGSSL